VARQAFSTALPALVIDRRSKGNLAGFAGPAFEAARGKLADHLLGGRLDQAGLLDANALRAVLRDSGPPKGSDYFRILQIADVESWARRWS
jgi:asparagine synthase (glutamine-hydrolysing)